VIHKNGTHEIRRTNPPRWTYVKFTQADAAHVRVTAKGAGSGKSGPVSWMRGEIEMTGWKADLDALVQEAMRSRKAFASNPPHRAPSSNRPCRAPS